MNFKPFAGFLLLCASASGFQAKAQNTVLAAGDIGMCNLQAPYWTGDLIRRELQKDPAARVLALGDLAYTVGSKAEFKACFDAAWGSFKGNIYPAPGNHEYETANAAGYFDYFAERAGKGYYGFDLGKWRVLSLNSNLSGEAMQQQIQWLKTDLDAFKGQCILAYWHHPLVSSGFHGNNSIMKPVWEVLQAHHADLVLVGHDHHYERFTQLSSSGTPDSEGIREFVVGTGGAVLYRTLFIKPGSEKHQNSQFGVLKLNLQDSGYSWEFLAANPKQAGKVLDSGSADCHAK
ncbi:metallophosphoesterase family protein [Deinococcus roseus]|nr:metallophosphoesterase [Deinococcus roseus]